MSVGVVLGPEATKNFDDSGVVLHFEYEGENYEVLITNTELDMLAIKAMTTNYRSLIKGGGLKESILLNNDGRAVLNVAHHARVAGNINAHDEVDVVASLYGITDDPNRIEKVFVFQKTDEGWIIESAVDTDIRSMSSIALEQYERITKEAIERARENDAKLQAMTDQYREGAPSN